jgi:uncharacterized protein
VQEVVMTDRAAALEALNRIHTFPGGFMFKIIGENSPEFLARVVQAAVTVVGPRATPSVTTRESAHGRHQAVTMVVEVASADLVLDIYAALQGIQGVRMLL